MAHTDNEDQDETSTSSSHMSIQRLRALAQSNLTGIEADVVVERQQQANAQEEIQRYMKPRRKDRSYSPSTHVLASEVDPVKGTKLRPAQDVLHRLQWDPSIDLKAYVVGYLERFEGIKEMPVSSWVRESTDEGFIPQHRIKFVKRRKEDGETEIVWDRDGRIDRIFGSGRSDDVGPEDAESEGGIVLV